MTQIKCKTFRQVLVRFTLIKNQRKRIAWPDAMYPTSSASDMHSSFQVQAIEKEPLFSKTKEFAARFFSGIWN